MTSDLLMLSLWVAAMEAQGRPPVISPRFEARIREQVRRKPPPIKA